MRRIYVVDTKKTKFKFLDVKIQIHETKNTLEFINSRLYNSRKKVNKFKNTEIV